MAQKERLTVLIYLIYKGDIMKNKNIYKDNGYSDRNDYFVDLSLRFNIDLSSVYALSEVMGKDEDFDGLVSSLDDYQYLNSGNAWKLN